MILPLMTEGYYHWNQLPVQPSAQSHNSNYSLLNYLNSADSFHFLKLARLYACHPIDKHLSVCSDHFTYINLVFWNSKMTHKEVKLREVLRRESFVLVVCLVFLLNVLFSNVKRTTRPTKLICWNLAMSIIADSPGFHQIFKIKMCRLERFLNRLWQWKVEYKCKGEKYNELVESN